MVDSAGVIRKRFVGPLTAETVDKELLPLLKQLESIMKAFLLWFMPGARRRWPPRAVRLRWNRASGWPNPGAGSAGAGDQRGAALPGLPE